MTKFKSGDKAEFIEKYGGYKIGDVVEIIDVVLGGAIVNAKGKQGIFPIHSDSLKLVEPKPSKNQRITALEKEVAELRPLKEKVEHLEQAVQQYFTVPGEPSTVEDKPKLKGITIELEKTPNQQRAEIIEKAKQFIEKHAEGFLFDSDKNSICAAKLEKFQDSVGYGACIGYSRCHRDDVFNEHIGKAIALGRALRLNVREFEQAVQPTEVVVGMIVQDYYKFKEEYITEIDNSLNFEYINEKIECYRKGVLNHNSFNARIINDTNAIY